MNEDHFAKLKNMYNSAPCNEYYAPSLSVYKGQATVSITVKPKMFHAGGALHGSVYFKAMDDAGYFAVNSLVTDCMVLTSSFNCYLTRAITSGVITAKGQVKHAGRKLYLAEVVLSDASGETAGRGSGVYMPSGMSLVEEMGYKL